jgi:hypothetical protein
MEELRFLRGPCREVISETRFAAYDRIQWWCVTGGENSGHYKNCLTSHEAK